MEQQEIINSWSLVSFCKTNGNPKFATLTNKQSGNQFQALMFNEGEKMVTFSDKMCQNGEDSFNFVMENTKNLNIIQLESGSYKICHKAQNSWEYMNII